MKKDKKDVLYLVPLKNGALVSMTMDQIEEDWDKIEPAKPGLAPKYQERMKEYQEQMQRKKMKENSKNNCGETSDKNIN